MLLIEGLFLIEKLIDFEVKLHQLLVSHLQHFHLDFLQLLVVFLELEVVALHFPLDLF